MLAKLKNKIVKKYFRALYGDKVVLKKRRDLLLLLRATNHIDRLLLSIEPFEDRPLEYLVGQIRENNIDVFVDVGANIGLYSLTMAKAAPHLEQIIAIEAQAENYNQLCGNIFLNREDNKIETQHIGASSAPGVVEFLKNKGGSTGTSRVRATAPASTKLHNFERHTIKVDTLDNLLGPIAGKKLCFKIDVEGHEYQVLQGMTRLLENNHCFMQMEILNDRDSSVATVCANFGLKKIHNIGCDVYFESER